MAHAKEPFAVQFGPSKLRAACPVGTRTGPRARWPSISPDGLVSSILLRILLS
jgi:hypothetical protein